MKYGRAFAVLGLLIAIYSIRNGGWFYLLLWPALSFALVSAAYLRAGVLVVLDFRRWVTITYRANQLLKLGRLTVNRWP